MSRYTAITALLAALICSALAVANASAEERLWRLLPGSAKETFTGKSGKLTFEGVKGSKITCEKSLILLTFGEASSELLENEAKLALLLDHFEGCKGPLNLPINSLGDAKEIILVHLEVHFCMISAGHFGWLIVPLPVHVEVPAAGLLISLGGSFIAEVLPLAGDAKHFEPVIKQEKGKQAIAKCEGGAEHSLTSKDDNEAVENVGEEVKEGLILMDGLKDKNGEEMMEK
jgi:hypothetical protein